LKQVLSILLLFHFAQNFYTRKFFVPIFKLKIGTFFEKFIAIFDALTILKLYDTIYIE